MCGICGYAGPDAHLVPIAAMTESLRHRGPDHSGCWTGSAVALGHTRLSVIDLSVAGHQPMQTPDGRFSIVFNGEIYNYRELRHHLLTKGQAFATASDTEVILEGYRCWGPAIVERLRGMFAFALWDESRRELLLARDRVGIKPLFYRALPQCLVFGSEIKAITASPRVTGQLDVEAVAAFMTYGFVPGPSTIFKGIRALGPGHALLWKQAHLSTWRYWEPCFHSTGHPASEADQIDELDARINEAVKTHLVADVPIGAFLSGGVDSSLVAAIAQRQNKETLQTFTIGFEGGGDERVYAQHVADHIGSVHRSKSVSAAMVQSLPALIWHLEQPLYDNSILPTYLVCRFARERVKVVLSGDGGDEPFGGYDWTRYALNLPFPALAKPVLGWKWAYRRGPAGLARRLIHDLVCGADRRYLRRMQVPTSLTDWLLAPGLRPEAGASSGQNTLERMLQCATVRDRRDRFSYTDLCFYLPEDVLFKVDRMSMAHGLEVRVPLLDHQLLEWLLTLPFDLRFRHGKGKYLLRKVAARYLPPETLRFRKQGFTVPVGRWLYGQLGELAGRIFSSASFGQRGIFCPTAAHHLLTMHRSRRYELGHRIWALVVFEIWARVWLDGQHPDFCMPERQMARK